MRPMLDPEAATTPPRPPLRGARFVARLVATALVTGLWAIQLKDALLEPAARGQRGFVSLALFVLGVPALYLLLALARRIWWERLRSRWFVALSVVVAVIGAPTLAGLVDDWGNARELADVKAQLQPLVAGLEKERAALGRPTLDLQPLLARHLPTPRGAYLRTRFSYRPGERDYGLAVGVTPKDRDAASWAYRFPDGQWRWLDVQPSGAGGLPALDGAAACACSFYEEWICEPPCGPGLEARSREAESGASPTPSPAPGVTPSPRGSAR